MDAAVCGTGWNFPLFQKFAVGIKQTELYTCSTDVCTKHIVLHGISPLSHFYSLLSFLLWMVLFMLNSSRQLFGYTKDDLAVETLTLDSPMQTQFMSAWGRFLCRPIFESSG
jgi:hypothetical protein